MSRFPSTIALLLAGLLLLGCSSSPWSTRRQASILLSTPAPARSTASPASSAASTQPDPQQMQEVMAELRQLGTLDPAAQDKLLEDLRESDPSLWPLVMQQFRATAAYRQRAMGRVATTQPAERLPPVNDVAATPTESLQEKYPRTADPPIEAEPPANQASSQVVQASYTQPAEKGTGPICRNGPEGAAHKLDLSPFPPVAGDWRQRLAGAIEALEVEVPKNPTTPAEMAQHARLRMLYAAAGRREDAVRPIPEAPAATQQFLSKELDGLTTWLNVEQTPDAARRAAKTKPALVEALSTLAESAPLVVHHMAFCTEVRSYGCAKRFEKYEFQPNQEVLLYAEVENFASEPTPKGYFTSLRSSYQILDGRGQRVVQHAFATTEEHCQNLRRDFFIGYHLRLPKGIGPGTYTLQLSIEDLKSQKVGQASIEFTIKEEKEPQMNTDKHR